MRKVVAFIVVALLILTTAAVAQGAAPPAASERKVTLRIAPNYPELAKRMRLQGVVRVEAVVRPNGSVRTTRVLGGNPVLVDAAVDAVRKWRFEPGPEETVEVVQLTFIPQ